MIKCLGKAFWDVSGSVLGQDSHRFVVEEESSEDLCALKGLLNGELLFLFCISPSLSSLSLLVALSVPDLWRKSVSVLSRNISSLCLFHEFCI